MVISVTLSDGSKQTLDVQNIIASVGGATVELSLNSAGLLQILSPGDDKRWQRFVVHLSAANALDLEVRSHGTAG